MPKNNIFKPRNTTLKYAPMFKANFRIMQLQPHPGILSGKINFGENSAQESFWPTFLVDD